MKNVYPLTRTVPTLGHKTRQVHIFSAIDKNVLLFFQYIMYHNRISMIFQYKLYFDSKSLMFIQSCGNNQQYFYWKSIPFQIWMLDAERLFRLENIITIYTKSLGNDLSKFCIRVRNSLCYGSLP